VICDSSATKKGKLKKKTLSLLTRKGAAVQCRRTGGWPMTGTGVATG